MSKYATDRVKEFFKAENRRAAMFSNGPIDYDVLKNFANTLRQEAAQAREAMFAALIKILTNVKSVFFSALDKETTEGEALSCWFSYQLHCRCVSARPALLAEIRFILFVSIVSDPHPVVP